MAHDDGRPAHDVQQPSSSVFSLDEFAELVSAALDINSDRFPDGKLALTLGPDSSSFLPDKPNNNKDYCTHTCTPSSTLGAIPAHLHQFHQREQPYPLLHQMHPPLGSLDFLGVSCVPCAPSGIASKFDSVPTITLTTPSPASPTSKSRHVLNKIKKGASAFVARTRTLSSPVKHVPTTSPSRTPPPPVPSHVLLNPKNADYHPISTVSISASFKNNVQLRSTVSLLDLENFNNNSAYSLATNTADFYDDESDFVPYLPLACQYERAFPKSPSMPSLHPGGSKLCSAGAIGAATPSVKSHSLGNRGAVPVPSTPGGNQPTRNRCISGGHTQHRNSRPDGRRRTMSAATASSVASTSDTASPVTPRSAAFLKIVGVVRSDRSQEPERDATSFLSLESGESEEPCTGVNDLGVKGVPELGGGTFDDDDDPFAKGSVQIVRSKSRARPTFQLYNPNLVIGPGSAGEPVIVSNIRSENASIQSSDTTSHDIHVLNIPSEKASKQSPDTTTYDFHYQHGAMSDSTSTSTSLAQPKLRPSRSPNRKGQRRERTPRPSVSPIPISRMKKIPVVFPLMPGETREDRRREEESQANQGDVEEWTLFLGKRDVPGSDQSDSEVEKGEEQEDDGGEKDEERDLEDKEKNAKGGKVKANDKVPVVDHARERASAKKISVPQLRITQFTESGAETASEGAGYVTGEDWTLMLPLYNVPKDPLLAQSERRGRNSSHSPASTSAHRLEIGDEERRRAASFTGTTQAIRSSFPSIPRSSVTIRPSLDEITLRIVPELSKCPPSSSSAIKPLTQESRDKPTSLCSNPNLSVILSGTRGSYCSNGSAESRISVASVASRTTSSTATVVPGPWQRDQIQQIGECSHTSESYQSGSSQRSDGERRLSTYSVRTVSTSRSSKEFAWEPSSSGGMRRSIVVSKMPLPIGWEAEVRARTVSMGGYRRGSWMSAADVSAGMTMGSSASLSSPLSREWRESERKKGKEREREETENESGGTSQREKDKNRESLMTMSGQWLTVSGREGSIRSVKSNETGGSRRRMVGGGNGSVGSVLLDDGASSCSGAYYSARSSFSLSG